MQGEQVFEALMRQLEAMKVRAEVERRMGRPAKKAKPEGGNRRGRPRG